MLFIWSNFTRSKENCLHKISFKSARGQWVNAEWVVQLAGTAVSSQLHARGSQPYCSSSLACWINRKIWSPTKGSPEASWLHELLATGKSWIAVSTPLSPSFSPRSPSLSCSLACSFCKPQDIHGLRSGNLEFTRRSLKNWIKGRIVEVTWNCKWIMPFCINFPSVSQEIIILHVQQFQGYFCQQWVPQACYISQWRNKIIKVP